MCYLGTSDRICRRRVISFPVKLGKMLPLILRNYPKAKIESLDVLKFENIQFVLLGVASPVHVRARPNPEEKLLAANLPHERVVSSPLI